MSMRILMLIPAALFLGTCWNELDVAVNRSRQKRTMADMRDAAQRFEQGTPFTAMRDGWATPIRVHAEGKHYSIISAGSDRRFEMKNPEGRVSGFDRDIILLDGSFAQMPDGI